MLTIYTYGIVATAPKGQWVTLDQSNTTNDIISETAVLILLAHELRPGTHVNIICTLPLIYTAKPFIRPVYLHYVSQVYMACLRQPLPGQWTCLARSKKPEPCLPIKTPFSRLRDFNYKDIISLKWAYSINWTIKHWQEHLLLLALLFIENRGYVSNRSSYAWFRGMQLTICAPIYFRFFNTLSPRQNCHHFAKEIFTCISWMLMHDFRLTFHRSLFISVRLTIFQHWVRSVAYMRH